MFSGILSSRDENGEEIETVQPGVATPSVEVISRPPPSIISALAKSQGEGLYFTLVSCIFAFYVHFFIKALLYLSLDVLSALQELDHLSVRNPSVLEVLSEQLSSLVLSPYSNIRTLAHTLLARLMKYNPQSNTLIGKMFNFNNNFEFG